MGFFKLFKKGEAKERRGGKKERPQQPAQENEEFFWPLPNALQVVRWQEQEGPFQGFGSPQGKF